MTEKRKRSFSIEEKMKILEAVDAAGKSKSRKELAAEFKIPVSTLATMLYQREKIQHHAQRQNVCPNSKRLRHSFYEGVDEAVFLWFEQARAQKLPVHGPIVQEKAREFALLLGFPEFRASAGWLMRFRNRYGIQARSKKSSGTNTLILPAEGESGNSEPTATSQPDDVAENLVISPEIPEGENARNGENSDDDDRNDVSAAQAFAGFKAVKNYLSNSPAMCDDVFHALNTVDDAMLMTLSQSVPQPNRR